MVDQIYWKTMEYGFGSATQTRDAQLVYPL
jgi:hypothetical protein